MLIKMLSTRRGSSDGFLVMRYYKDETYEIPHTMAAMFLRNGWAYNAEAFNDADPMQQLENLRNLTSTQGE